MCMTCHNHSIIARCFTTFLVYLFFYFCYFFILYLYVEIGRVPKNLWHGANTNKHNKDKNKILGNTNLFIYTVVD